MTITSKAIEKIKCEIQNKIEGYEKSLKDHIETEEKLKQDLLKCLDKMKKSEELIREAKKELNNIEEYKDFIRKKECLMSEKESVTKDQVSEEEAKIEKKRLWWESKGRDVWELRLDDVLYEGGNIYFVHSLEGQSVVLYSHLARGYSVMYYQHIEKYFRVVCFAENREDKNLNFYSEESVL